MFRIFDVSCKSQWKSYFKNLSQAFVFSVTVKGLSETVNCAATKNLVKDEDR